jgi:Ankyrin repeats (3 copies)/Ankyrin repeats (many copies)
MRVAKFYRPVVLGVLAVSAGAGASDTYRATVNAEAVPIFAETAQSSAVVKKLTKGEIVTIAYTVATGEGDWCSMSDRAGYVLCGYLTREEPPKPETTGGPLPAVLTNSTGPSSRPQPRAPQAIPHPLAEPALFTPEQSALMSAAKAGNITAIQLALGKGAALNGGDKDGKTALMWASYMGHADAVKELLSAGADANAADSLGWTALEAAVWARRSAALELLLEQGADANARDSEGRTSLMHAAQYGDLIMMRQLLTKGADPNARNRFEQTPLMFAVALNDPAAAALLLDADADVNARDAAGRSVLINAVLASTERVPVVQALTRAGADVNARDNEGRTALALAMKKGDTAIAQLLKKAGASQ